MKDEGVSSVSKRGAGYFFPLPLFLGGSESRWEDEDEDLRF